MTSRPVLRPLGPLLVAAVLLSACAPGGEALDQTYRADARNRVEAAVGAMMGASERAMRDSLGRPLARLTKPLADGARQLTWRRGRGRAWCEVKASFDRDGRVTAATWRDAGSIDGLRHCDLWLGARTTG